MIEPGVCKRLGFLSLHFAQHIVQKNHLVEGEIIRLAQTSPQTGQQ